MNVSQIIEYISKNAPAITIILGGTAGIIKFWQWVNIKKTEDKQRKFETYHKLIKDLVEPDKKGKEIKLDRQIAIIYELTNYKQYYSVSKRILQGLLISWKDNKRLVDEINITLNYINNYWFFRFFIEK